VIDVRGPEPVETTLARVDRQDGMAGSGPGLVDVLHDVHKFSDKKALLPENGDFLVDTVESQNSSLFFPNSSCSYSKSTPSRPNAIPTLTTYGIAHPTMSFTSGISSPLQAVASSPLRTLL
ncbi:unnamed protein product, partial [Musa textilis]